MTAAIKVDELTAIDVHVHLEHEAPPTEADAAARKYFGKSTGEAGARALAEYYRSRRMACVVFTVDEQLTGRPHLTNDAILAFAAANPDIVLPFVSVNPTRGASAVEEARRLVATGAVRGLKLHPPLQEFFPNDRLAYPLYEVFAEARLPVLFHTGHSGIGTGMPGGGGIRLKYGNPMHIDDVAVDFPDMPIILAHPSFPWQDKATSSRLPEHVRLAEHVVRRAEVVQVRQTALLVAASRGTRAGTDGEVTTVRRGEMSTRRASQDVIDWRGQWRISEQGRTIARCSTATQAGSHDTHLNTMRASSLLMPNTNALSIISSLSDSSRPA